MPVSKRARKSKRSVKSRKLRGGSVLGCAPGFTTGYFSTQGLDDHIMVPIELATPELLNGRPYYTVFDEVGFRVNCYDPDKFDPEQHMRNLAEWQAVRDRQNAEMREANYESGRKFRSAANMPVSSLPTIPDGMTQEEFDAQQAELAAQAARNAEAQAAYTAQWEADSRSQDILDPTSPYYTAPAANAAATTDPTMNTTAPAAMNTTANAPLMNTTTANAPPMNTTTANDPTALSMGGRRSKARKTKSRRAMKKRRTVKRRGVKGRKGY